MPIIKLRPSLRRFSQNSQMLNSTMCIFSPNLQMFNSTQCRFSQNSQMLNSIVCIFSQNSQMLNSTECGFLTLDSHVNWIKNMGSTNMDAFKLLNMAFTAPIFTKPVISQCHDAKFFYIEFRSNRKQKWKVRIAF